MERQVMDNQWKDGWKDKEINEQVGRWMDREMDAKVKRWMNGWKEGWTDRELGSRSVTHDSSVRQESSRPFDSWGNCSSKCLNHWPRDKSKLGERLNSTQASQTLPRLSQSTLMSQSPPKSQAESLGIHGALLAKLSEAQGQGGDQESENCQLSAGNFLEAVIKALFTMGCQSGGQVCLGAHTLVLTESTYTPRNPPHAYNTRKTHIIQIHTYTCMHFLLKMYMSTFICTHMHMYIFAHSCIHK